MTATFSWEDFILRQRPRLMLIFVAVIVLLPGTGTMPLIDRDEPRFAQATREMMERGEWIIPYFNDEYRFDKPVLTYWMMRVNYWLFGINEFGARFHSIITTIGTALLIFEIGKRIGSSAMGFWAGFMWLTCLQVWIHGRLSLADMPMVMAVTATHWALYELLIKQNEKRWLWFWVLYASLGLGFLAKGPIAWFCPMLALALFRFAFYRNPLPWRNLKFGLGLIVVLAIVGSWGIPALLKTQGQFWQVGIQHHVIDRGTEAFHGRFILPGYYLLTALFSLFPWIMLLGVMIQTVRQRWDATQAFLVSWLAAPYLIFSFYATQLPHYVLPGFPAFFLLMAPVLAEKIEPAGKSQYWYTGIQYAYMTLVFILIGTIFISLGNELNLVLIWVLLLLNAYQTLPIYIHIFNKKKLPLFTSLGIILMSGFIIGWHVYRYSPSIQINTIADQLSQQTACLDNIHKEPSMVFYGNKRWEFFRTQDEAVEVFLKHKNAMWVYAKEEWKIDDFFKQTILRQEIKPQEPITADVLLQNQTFAYFTETVEGINPARASWVKLHIVIRGDGTAP